MALGRILLDKLHSGDRFFASVGHLTESLQYGAENSISRC